MIKILQKVEKLIQIFIYKKNEIRIKEIKEKINTFKKNEEEENKKKKDNINEENNSINNPSKNKNEKEEDILKELEL